MIERSCVYKQVVPHLKKDREKKMNEIENINLMTLKSI